ncbi:MAG: alkyl sulfatase dimerization domain-containing protein [Dehalococcoidia bacterium]
MTSEQLDYRTAQGRDPRDAAFYYRGPTETVTEGVVFFPDMGNATAFICDGRIMLVDTTGAWIAPGRVEAFRSEHADAPIEAIVYTHGHIDHTTGAAAWIADAGKRGHKQPRIVAHQDLPRRFDRYRMLGPQNDFINTIQFSLPDSFSKAFTTVPWTYPDEVYNQSLVTTVGGERFELYHCRGETDDETWVWNPSRRVLCTGDTFVWCTPNAGNPYKVQRYARNWAQGLEAMAALRPAFLCPGHGPVLAGEEAIQEALTTTAAFLRSIHDQVVAKMNEGKWLEDIIREIDWPSTDHPWLRPIYDHPEFIARNVYRLYGGWYSGDPADMLPAHSEDVARELVGVCGAGKLLARARALRDSGDPDGQGLKLACHIVDFVRKGEPDNREAWELWRELFAARVEQEDSLMARGAFHAAVREAERRLGELG